MMFHAGALAQQLNVTTYNYMLQLTASIQAQQPAQFLIDNNAEYSLAWSDTCLMTDQLAESPDLNCTAAPTYVTESTSENELTGKDQPFANLLSGGYEVTGTAYTGNMTIDSVDLGSNITVLVVDTISKDTYLYGQSVQSGSLALGPRSQIATQLSNSSVFSWLVNPGCFGNQTYAGGSCTQPSDFELTYGVQYTASNAVNLTNINGTYGISSIYFGVSQSASYFQQLGNPQVFNGTPNTAVIAFNYQGIGLPQYLWDQVVSMLYRDSLDQQTFTCYSSPLSNCTYNADCQSLLGLSNGLSFLIQFANQSDYVVVDLAAFSQDIDGTCVLFVQESNQVILGSMFLQQFVAYFYQSEQQTLLLTPAETSLTSTFVGNTTINNTNIEYFTQSLSDSTFRLPIKTTPEMVVTIEASIGYLPVSNFKVSFTSNNIYTFAQNCTNCANFPNYATPYLNYSQYLNTIQSPQQIAGYQFDTTVIQEQICVLNQGLNDFYCSVQNQPVFVITDVVTNSWNKYTNASAGIIGLNTMSAIWTQILTCSSQNYQVALSNLTDWTFVDPSYTTVTNSSINFCVAQPEEGIQLSLNQDGTFNSTGFGFGLTYQDGSQSYVSLIDTNETILLSLEFQGLGLPYESFAKFTNLLQIATQGQAYCNEYCVLSQPCNMYPQLWSYSFLLQEQLVLPLATVAIDGEQCKINVQEIESIVLGSMVFQQIVMTVQDSVTISINPNALPQTKIQPQGPPGPQAFNTSVVVIPISQVNVTLDSQPVTLLNNLNSNETVVWAYNCTQTLSNASCSQQPTNLNQTQTSGDWLSSYSNITFNGFSTSGNIFLSKIQNSITPVYAADLVTSDSLLYGLPGENGLLALGIMSQFWQQYINPYTMSAQYQINATNITIGVEPEISQLVLSNTGDGYLLESMSFGIMYTDSQYQQQICGQAEQVFDVAVQGLGLPSSAYDALIQLLSAVVIDLNCTAQGCETLTSCDQLTDYYFIANYPNQTNYIRIPLVTFTIQQEQCILHVSTTNQILFGSMFFSQFRSIFTNNYSPITQQLSLYGPGYIGNESLPIGPNPFIGLPQYVPSQLFSNMLQVQAQIMSQVPQWFFIDNNALYNVAWTTNCTSEQGPCTEPPFYLQDSTSPLSNCTGFNQTSIIGGYIFNGNECSQMVTIGTTTSLQQVIAADYLFSNTWLYDVHANSGLLSLQQQFLINDQIFVGPGNYSTLWTGNQSNSVSLSKNQNETYDLQFIGFGANDNYSQLGNNYTQNSYSKPATTALIAFNYIGIGLPTYMYRQYLSLLKQSDTQDLYFKIQFTDQSNYIVIPLSVLITDQSWVQETSQTDVIFGSLFLQQFTVYNNNITLQLTPFTNNSVITNETLQPGSSPFHANTTVRLPLQIRNLIPLVNASLDFQPIALFQINLNSDQIITYALDCQIDYPDSDQYCNEYFNTYDYFNSTGYTVFAYEQYIIDGMNCLLQTNKAVICLQSVCSVEPQPVQVVYEIFSGDESYKAAGLVSVTNYTVQLSNLTDLTFAQPDYSPKQPDNYLYLNQEFNQSTYIQIETSAELSFGIIYPDNTAYYQLVASLFVTPDLTIRGIVLPPDNYQALYRLLVYATNGTISCDLDECVLPNPCSSYEWQYTFKLQFQAEYFIIPLATLAYDLNTTCVINIQSGQEYYFLLGSMVFQQLSLYSNSTLEALYVNPNALNQTFQSDSYMVPGPSPFVVHPVSLPMTSTSVNASVEHQQGNYLINFDSSDTYVLLDNCTYQSMPCQGQLMKFDSDQYVGQFYISNYYITAQGNVYLSQVCIALSCRYMYVYAVDQIFEGGLQQGLLGFGAQSRVWEAYINPDTNIATYSVQLAPSRANSVSNVTLGNAGDLSSYENQSYVSALGFNYFNLSELTFGLVYYTDNAATSQFYSSVLSTPQLSFSIAYQGLGLPLETYNTLITLLQTLSPTTQTSKNIQIQNCSLVQDYSFVIQLQNQSNTNYIRIPLTTFAGPNCSFEIQVAPQVVLGSMFFQQFLGVFQNQYLAATFTYTMQNVTLLVNQNAVVQGYIGDQTYPLGPNPFYPPSPSKSNVGTIIGVCVAVVVVLSVTGFLVYRKYKQQPELQVSVNNDETQEEFIDLAANQSQRDSIADFRSQRSSF